jgi:hypothetical protein
MYDVPPHNTSYNHHSQAVEHLPDQLCTILRVLFMPKCFALNSRRPFTRTLFSTLSTVRPPTSDRCMPALTRMHRYTPTPIRRSTGAIAIRCRCDARRPSLHRGCIGWQGHRLTHESVSSHVCVHSCGLAAQRDQGALPSCRGDSIHHLVEVLLGEHGPHCVLETAILQNEPFGVCVCEWVDRRCAMVDASTIPYDRLLGIIYCDRTCAAPQCHEVCTVKVRCGASPPTPHATGLPHMCTY